MENNHNAMDNTGTPKDSTLERPKSWSQQPGNLADIICGLKILSGSECENLNSNEDIFAATVEFIALLQKAVWKSTFCQLASTTHYQAYHVSPRVD